MGPGIGGKAFNTSTGELEHQMQTLADLMNEYRFVNPSWKVPMARGLIQAALWVWGTIHRPRVTDHANTSYFI